MNSVMVASFMDELTKIATGNFAAPIKPAVGGNGANTVAKPLPSPGFGPTTASPKPAKPTNYSIVNPNPPTANIDNAGGEMKALEPPAVRT
jgi:hypothetical protein